MTTERPDDEQEGASLADSIVALAGTPADAGDIDAQLVAIAQLAVGTLAAVSYASVTALRDDAPTTVAASSDLAVAVDEAQYAELDGPCLDALRQGAPVVVADIDATMLWPGFRAAAVRMGLRAALSIPLFDGSGATVAVLNLFGHDPAAMAVLGRHVDAAHHRDRTGATAADHPPLGPDGQELIRGITTAFDVLATIQQAVGLIMAREGCSAEDAYLILRERAAETGARLPDIAAAMIQRCQHSRGDSYS